MLFVKDQFLDVDVCSSIIENTTFKRESFVYNSEGEAQNKTDYRLSHDMKLEDSVKENITSRLLDLIPALTKKFDFVLNEMSPINLLKYEEGHFFKRHTDNSTKTKAARRKLTALIYLNSSSKYDDSELAFEGGEILIYGIHEKFPHVGLPIYPKACKLLIFPSHLLHEVKPIIKGTRYCIVAWYLE